MATAASEQMNLSARANLINCWIVLDNSASMSGNKWNMARAGVLSCVQQLTDSDYFGLLVFGESIREVVSDFKKDLSLAPFNSVKADGGGTALYDAIVQAGTLSVKLHAALSNACKNAGASCITYVIVLTDGDDNRSQLKADHVSAFLQQVNQMRGFKVVLAGVGLGSNATSVMRSFGAIGDSDISFRNLNSVGDIEQLFEHVTIEIARTRQVVHVAADGTTAIIQTREAINIQTGETRSGGGAIIATNRQTQAITGSPQSLQITNGSNETSKASPVTQSKPRPEKTSDYWNSDKYELNSYEKKAKSSLLCFKCCCFNICQPGMLDHMCCRYPSCGLGNCIADDSNCCVGCFFCLVPINVICCPIWYCKCCCIGCSENDRYEYDL